MPANPMNSGAFSQLISKDFSNITLDSYNEMPTMFDKVANVTTTQDAYIREGQMMGLTALQAAGDGQPVNFESFTQGNEKTTYPTLFQLGVAITQIMYDDDKTGYMKKAFAELGKAAAYTKELKFWDIFNAGFVTTTRTGIDSAALFASHTLLGGSTYSNYASSAGALSMTTLQSGLNAFAKMVKENSVPCPTKASLLVVPPELRFTAEKLTKNEFNPENANNEKNYSEVTGLQFMVVPYLTSTTAWFLLSEKSMHDLRFIWRKQLQLTAQDDFVTSTAMFKATMRFIATFYNYRGTYGNAGA